MKATDIIKKIRLTSNTFLGIVIGIALLLLVGLLFLIKPAADVDASDEIQNIAQTIRKGYQKSFDYHGLDTKVAIEKKLLPDNMVRQNKIFSRLNSEILIGSDMDGKTIGPMNKTFSVVYSNLNKNKCLSLSTTLFDETSGLIKVTIQNDDLREFSYGGEYELPITKEDAKEFCKAKNKVMFTFE